MGPFRQTDAVLTVAQDNSRKAIEVTAANDAAGEITGFSPQELKGKPFSEIVSAKIAEALEDYVEFYPGANDVGDVLRKVRDFQLKNRDGKDIPFKLRIVRHNSIEHDEYLLILHNAEAQRETDGFLASLRTLFAQPEGAEEGTLPGKESFVAGIELATQQLDKVAKGISFAVLELDNYETILAKQGIQACQQVSHDVAKLCAQNLRDNDVVVQYSPSKLGLLLVGASKDPAQMVLNRLRWLVAGQTTALTQGGNAQTTLSILFHELTVGDEAAKLIERIEQTLVEKPADSQNIVVYV